MKRIVLDTNAYTALLRGDEKVLDVISEAEVVNVPVIVLGELYAGFKGGTREDENRQLLQAFLRKDSVRIVFADVETAQIFGEIKYRLKSAGTPVPINDVWIAANTMQTGSFLVSFDLHFQKIQGLLLWSCMDR